MAQTNKSKVNKMKSNKSNKNKLKKSIENESIEKVDFYFEPVVKETRKMSKAEIDFHLEPLLDLCKALGLTAHTVYPKGTQKGTQRTRGKKSK